MREYIKKWLSPESLLRILYYLLYMLLVLLAQTMVITHVRGFGVCAFILPAAAVAVGMFRGASWGTLFGLLMGLITDMFFVESNILYTILFPIIGFATGFVSHFYVNKRFISYIVVTAIAFLLTGAAQMIATAIADVWSISMIPTILLQTLWSLPLAVLVYLPPAKWIA